MVFPLAPRWSASREERPTFVWGLSAANFQAPGRGEILVVDEDESLVATIPIPELAPAGDAAQVGRTRPIATPFPDASPPLAAGQAYAWKVNYFADGEWVASDYVPFRVLAPKTRELLERQLAELSEEPFLRSVAFASHGLYWEALGALAEVPKTESNQTVLLEAELLLAERARLAEPEAELVKEPAQ